MEILSGLVSTAAKYSPFNIGVGLLSNHLEKKSDAKVEGDLFERKAKIFKETGYRETGSTNSGLRVSHNPHPGPGGAPQIKVNFPSNSNFGGGPTTVKSRPMTPEERSSLIRNTPQDDVEPNVYHPSGSRPSQFPSTCSPPPPLPPRGVNPTPPPRPPPRITSPINTVHPARRGGRSGVVPRQPHSISSAEHFGTGQPPFMEAE